MLAAGVVVVPSVFWIGIEEAFVVPKLVALVVVAGLCTMQSFASGRFGGLRPHAVDMGVGAFAVLLVASTVWSVDRGQSVWGETYQRQGLVATALYVAAYAIGRVAITGGFRLLLLCRAITLGGLPVAVYAIAQRVGLDPLWDEIPNGRVFSTIGQTNSLGAYLALVVPVAVGSAVAGGRRPGWWALALIEATALLLTESRGGALGVAVGLGLLGVLLLRRHDDPAGRRRVVLGMVGAAVVVAAAVTTVPGVSESSERVWSRARSADEWTSGSVRNHLDLWVVAREVILDRPVLGSGPDTFPLVFGDHRDEVLAPDSAARLRAYRVESPHNIVLAHAAGMGVGAAVLLGVILLAPVASVVRARRGVAASAAASGIVGGLVASCFITADLTTTWLLWTLAGALVGATAAQSRSAVASGGRVRSAADAGDHSASS